jgi:putative Mg2+ transporter-C (MgtC) family protein
MEELYFSHADIFIKLTLALILGCVLGMERVVARKTAGIRTYGLVSLGSCLFVLISNYLTGSLLYIVDIDPLRTISGIITGVGFIGAGMIILRRSEKITGLTTAAGIWVASAIGIAVAVGMEATAIFVTCLSLFTFTGLWFLEQKIKDMNGDGVTVVVKKKNFKKDD